MRVAVVYDWLTVYAGAERVLEQILRLYPEADLFSLIDFLPEDRRGFILNKNVRTSFLQRMPWVRKKYRNYLPLMPPAVERFDFSAYDLVISASHAVAKGARTAPGQLHLCYCFTPMRYAWDLQYQYLRESNLDRGVRGAAARMLLRYLRNWDRAGSARVDHFVTLSRYIAERIRNAYGREATVIYPPVDLDRFKVREKKEDFFLAASRMVPYKKMDLIAEAFSEMGLPLVVIGDGPDFEKVKRKARKNVVILGYQDDDVLRDRLERARGFVFAAEEDFGILPVEAQACGTPVIAFGRGGATETIVENQTGVFFQSQTVGGLTSGINEFLEKEDSFDPWIIRKNAERFNRDRFIAEFKQFVDSKVEAFLKNR
ncbi:MAG: glycosyltransferase family 4 protein [Nitrospirae bacterium]|nr:glycosyltransferase family 4 protein [Nitrospirota bacterium]